MTVIAFIVKSDHSLLSLMAKFQGLAAGRVDKRKLFQKQFLLGANYIIFILIDIISFRAFYNAIKFCVCQINSISNR